MSLFCCCVFACLCALSLFMSLLLLPGDGEKHKHPPPAPRRIPLAKSSGPPQLFGVSVSYTHAERDGSGLQSRHLPLFCTVHNDRTSVGLLLMRVSCCSNPHHSVHRQQQQCLTQRAFSGSSLLEPSGRYKPRCETFGSEITRASTMDIGKKQSNTELIQRGSIAHHGVRGSFPLGFGARTNE